MTEKRYELKCHEINSYYIEKDGKVLIFDLFKSDAEILCAELNNLSDENEQLKKEYSEQCIQLNYLKDENKHMRDVLEENKQLIQQCKDFMEMLDDMNVAYLINDDLKYILGDWE